MYLHGNAKLGLAGRFALVQAIEQGCSIRAAAERFGVSAGMSPPLSAAIFDG
jgi:molybdenum-dependent DNA-binding transcriptional regulator ModE